MNENHYLLCKISRCWYCGDEIDEPKEYATCSDECWTLLMHSQNRAWCDNVTDTELKELQQAGDDN